MIYLWFPKILSTLFLGLSLILGLVASISANNLLMSYTFTLTSMLEIVIPLWFDKFSGAFSATVLMISAAVMMFSRSYMQHEKYFYRFHTLVLCFILSMLVLVLSPNLVSMILGWDGLGVTSFLLVLYFNSTKAFNASMLTALSNRVGDCALFIGMALFMGSWGSNHFLASAESSLPLYSWFVALFLIASMTKSAQIPFSAWLPAAMAAPTPVSSLVHSSTLVTAGVYIMIRFNLLLAPEWAKLLFMIGCCTMIMASLAATLEVDMKKIVALSTLSQLGLMMTAIGLNCPELSLFHLLTHAFFKALLFMSVGNLIHMNSDYQDLRLASLRHKALGPTLTLSLIANMSLMGTPFLAGFYSKDLILESSWLASLNLLEGLLLSSSIFLTALYSVRFLVMVFLGNSMNPALVWVSDNEKFSNRGMSYLWAVAIMGGSMLSWGLVECPYTTVLPSFIKILFLFLLFGGGGLGGLMFKTSVLKLKFLWSWGLMWGMPELSSRVFSGVVSASDSAVKLDKTWAQAHMTSPFQKPHRQYLKPKRWASSFNYLFLFFAIALIVVSY